MNRGGGAVIWLTGLSGAGKSTIATALVDALKPARQGVVLIDGDTVRALFGGDLAYHEAARREQIGRIQRLAHWLGGQGLCVVVAALYAHPELLAWNRANLPGYFEIYVDAPMNLLRTRDTKGLYAGAAAGAVSSVVGVDIPWHAPEHPDMVVDAARMDPPAETAQAIARRLRALMAQTRAAS